MRLTHGNHGYNDKDGRSLDNHLLVLISAATFGCRIRILCRGHEIVDPSCCVSMVQAAGGVMVGGYVISSL